MKLMEKINYAYVYLIFLADFIACNHAMNTVFVSFSFSFFFFFLEYLGMYLCHFFKAFPANEDQGCI